MLSLIYFKEWYRYCPQIFKQVVTYRFSIDTAVIDNNPLRIAYDFVFFILIRFHNDWSITNIGRLNVKIVKQNESQNIQFEVLEKESSSKNG